ncbi:MAG TPA: enolase C-terminal domain-like protein, partial [Acidimicrobiia bacterium]|nr:enolase C-terminal domain-like protein [Acidimicrobiia bacterium]
MARPSDAAIEGVDVAAYTIPTDQPESDGTLEWDATTMVLARIHAGGETGLGYTYGSQAVATLIEGKLASVLLGQDPTNIAALWQAMRIQLRNEGYRGESMMAVSALDVALWDLKARLLGVPVVHLLNTAHEAVPIYGSGGFTSYPLERIAEQLGGWAGEGIGRVKMKVGRNQAEDPARLDAARKAIGADVELFVDANGAYSRKQAVEWAERFRSEWDVRWFEEPVSSDDVEGLALVRDRGPGGMDIAAGEYGYELSDFRRWLGAVDCLQADVTRCGGFTGMARVSGLCDAHCLDLSGHCAPALSAHALCAAVHMRHLEYFHDHVRIERLLF